MDFAISGEYTEKIKESEKGDKYVDLIKELKKKLWNMKVAVMLIVVGALGTILNRLLKGVEDLEIRGQIEIIQTTTLLRPARILRRIRRLEKTCCHLNSIEKQSANAVVKKSRRNK